MQGPNKRQPKNSLRVSEKEYIIHVKVVSVIFIELKNSFNSIMIVWTNVLSVWLRFEKKNMMLSIRSLVKYELHRRMSLCNRLQSIDN